MKRLLLFALLATSAFCQQGPESPTRVVTADPSGNCIARVQNQFNERNGRLWGCVDVDGDGFGTWTQISGSGGSGGATIAPTTNLIKGDGVGNGGAATPGTDYVVPGGNVATASAFATNPANCSTAGTFPNGIAAAGTPENCTRLPQQFFGTAAPGSVFSNLPGDLFSDTTNHNIYQCNAPSATAAPACTSVTAGGWTLINGGVAATYQVSGSPVATETTANFIPGTGILQPGTNPSGKFQLTTSLDTAIALTRATDQSGVDAYLRSTTGNDTYTALATPTLLTYTRGSCFTLDVDTANTGTASVNIDTLGAVTILRPDGTTLFDGDVPANTPKEICYDGTNFILQGGTKTPFLSGTSFTFSKAGGLGECTGTCTVTMPVPFAGGPQVCVRNANNVATVITFAAIGSSVQYENQAGTGYGTAGSGTAASSGALKDKFCYVGKDATHYDLWSDNGTLTTN